MRYCQRLLFKAMNMMTKTVNFPLLVQAKLNTFHNLEHLENREAKPHTPDYRISTMKIEAKPHTHQYTRVYKIATLVR